MNFIELKQAMGQWLGVSEQELPDLIRGQIINIVQRAYCHLTESRFGETSDFFRTRLEIRDYPLPLGWSRPRSFWYQDPSNGSDVVWIDYVQKDTFDLTFPTSGLLGSTFVAPVGGGTLGGSNLGEPTIYTVWAGQIMLGPVPNRVFSIFRNYWRIPADLTDAIPENEFTRQGWEYLLFASLVEASKFGFEDARIPIWQEKAKDLKTDLMIEDARSRTTAQLPVSTEPG